MNAYVYVCVCVYAYAYVYYITCFQKSTPSPFQPPICVSMSEQPITLRLALRQAELWYEPFDCLCLFARARCSELFTAVPVWYR